MSRTNSQQKDEYTEMCRVEGRVSSSPLPSSPLSLLLLSTPPPSSLPPSLSSILFSWQRFLSPSLYLSIARVGRSWTYIGPQSQKRGTADVTRLQARLGVMGLLVAQGNPDWVSSACQSRYLRTTGRRGSMSSARRMTECRHASYRWPT